MVHNINNLVFAGGGILGISYLGALDYLNQNGLLQKVSRTAGTSAGAIAACLTSLSLPFEEMKAVVNSLDYSRVPYTGDTEAFDILPKEVEGLLNDVFGDINCLYRLISRYGWFSSQYLYEWLKSVLEKQFNSKKQPPYTFADFHNPSLHRDNRPFYDLYVIGTDLTNGTSQVFSYETTPNMEVAEAVRISISIPLFFEAVDSNFADPTGPMPLHVCCDGGVLNNYPIKLFDSPVFNRKLSRGANPDTLGMRFISRKQSGTINNLLDYITRLVYTYSHIQQEEYYNSPMDRIRSINIDPMETSFINFNITPNDETYRLLYHQGYIAASDYFQKKPAESMYT